MQGTLNPIHSLVSTNRVVEDWAKGRSVTGHWSEVDCDAQLQDMDKHTINNTTITKDVSIMRLFG